MTDRTHSVFPRIVAVMASMAAVLLVLVAGFFWFVATPEAGGAIHRVLETESRQIAAGSPDLDTARRLGDRLGLEMRYEGPAGVWSTSDALPDIALAPHGRHTGRISLLHNEYYVVPAPDGGSYLFAWGVSEAMRGAHVRLLTLLLLVMAAVVVGAHVALTRQLRPLAELSEGVARLSAGELDVVLSTRTRDEFGRLTAAFNEMVGRVRDMIAARDQLLLDVSHELRSPLTRMKVALELLPPGERRTEIAADVAEMDAMVTELLELERLRSGALRRRRQNLMPIVGEVAESFRGRSPGVTVASASGDLHADVDPERVRTALRNLLDNAIKYSLPDSQPVDISAALTGDRIIIRVTDDGPGIPEPDKARLFEPFFRVDRSRSKKTGGYGLGLSIAKRIIEAHGGTIDAENNPGRGASFTVSLPATARSG